MPLSPNQRSMQLLGHLPCYLGYMRRLESERSVCEAAQERAAGRASDRACYLWAEGGQEKVQARQQLSWRA
jgi:hypothetical protein